MKKTLILLLSFLYLSVSSMAFAKNDGYKIDISAPQLKNENINLAMYFYGKLYAKDTLVLNEKGNGSFQKKENLPEGLYAIYFSGSKYFDIVIEENQHFKIKIDTTDLVHKTEISGAEQTVKFNEFVKFISAKKTLAFDLQKKQEEYKEGSKEKEAIKEKITTINKEVDAYQKNIINTYENKTVGKILKAILPIEIPEDMTAENDSLLQIKKYYYSREHYFDNINLSDPTLLYTNVLQQKVDFYLNKVLPQIPDTLTTEAIALIEKASHDTLTFQNMTSQLLNFSIKSKIMGMDKLLLAIAENYYLSGRAYWADSTLLADLEKEVKKIKYNQIGSYAANLSAETLEGTKVSLNNTAEDFILLYFYEPSCGHCKKETPKLHDEVYQKYKNKGFEVFAFYTHTDKKEWEEFVGKHQLYDWTNVWDPNRESFFWHYYDVSSTPSLYLINKERKIVAKKIDLGSLDMILDNELNKEKK